MKAIKLLERAEEQHFKRLKPELIGHLTFDEYWNTFLKSIVELEVSFECISGVHCAVKINSIEIMNDLETKEVTDNGYWVFVYIGHSGEFDLHNYKTKDEAERKVLDFEENELVTSIFIVY